MQKLPARQLKAGEAPQPVGQTNSEGTSDAIAHADHVHAHGAQPIGAGTDHAGATTALAGFQSAADKTKLNGIPSNADNTVTALAAASAPVSINGQKLTSVGTPTTGTDGANKTYVDGAVSAAAPTAGNGLTPSGLAINVTPHADGSIAVHTDDVQVGVLATDAQHGSRGGGTTHAVASGSAPGFMAAADFTKLAGIPSNADNTLGVLAATVAAVSVNSQKITGVATPTASTDAANKAYVDAVAQGLDVKASVRLCDNTNRTQFGLLIVDGVQSANGDRVLCFGQTVASQNGIFNVVTGGAWTRATDADTSAKVTSGMFTFVTEGTRGGNGYVLTTPDPITLGTTALTFGQFSGAGQIDPGAGLMKTGNQLNVVAADATIVVGADDVKVGVITDTNHGLRGSGSTASPAHAVATAGAPGFMSAADFSKLAAIAAGATNTPLATVAPPAIAAAAALGTSGNVAREDHTHAGVQLASTSPADVGTATVGVLATAARGDHVHAHGNQPGGALHADVVAAGASGFMTGADKTKIDGIAVGATALALSSTTPAPTSTTGAVGVGATAARADHVHAVPFSGATPAALTATGSAGASTNIPRADHVHPHGAQTDGTMHAVATTGVAGFQSAADKTKLDGIATGATATAMASTVTAVGTSTVGVSANAAREDHVHAHGNQASNDTMHAAATSAVAGFMSAVDKAKLDGTLLAMRYQVENVATSNINLALTTVPALVDGPTWGNSSFNKVLLTAQTAKAENGLWRCDVDASGVASWQRIAFNWVISNWETPTAANYQAGFIVRVFAGNSAFVGALYTCSMALNGVVGTTAIVVSTLVQIAAITPAQVGASGLPGTGTAVARADHVHAHGNQAAGTSLHTAVVSGGANGFMAGTDKARVDQMITRGWDAYYASTANVDLTLTTAPTIDGVLQGPNAVNNYLLAAQTNKAENGLWFCTTVSGVATWTRVGVQRGTNASLTMTGPMYEAGLLVNTSPTGATGSGMLYACWMAPGGTLGTSLIYVVALTGAASPSSNGLMSVADKIKLNALAAGAAATVGRLTVDSVYQLPTSAAYASTVTLDVSIKNDFTLACTASGNVTINFNAFTSGRQGTILFKQHTTGNCTITWQVAGSTPSLVLKDVSSVDLVPQAAASSYTMYTYQMVLIGGVSALILSKTLLN